MPEFLRTASEMVGRVREFDWAATPLGPIESWQRSVRTAVRICLTSSFPIVIWLGPELRIIYNDAYIPFLREKKHPAMLGEPGRIFSRIEAGRIEASFEPTDLAQRRRSSLAYSAPPSSGRGSGLRCAASNCRSRSMLTMVCGKRSS